jgi:MFS transporter, ACS family, aldohexuronate transporter
MVVLVLFAGSVNNYLDRAILSVVMPQVRKDLSLTNADYGLALNAFLILYMVFYVLGGRLSDRLGCRRMFLIALIFWSTASTLHALVRGLASLCLFRALLGAGEGGFYPTAIRGVSEWFRPENRAKAVGLLMCGISIGSLLTPPIVAWIALHYGWRASFLLTGASGFLLAVVWVYLHRVIKETFAIADPAPAERIGPQSEEIDEEDLTATEALKRRKYWFVLLARAMTDASWFFYLFWIPGYFQVVRGFDLARVGRLLWIPFFFADIGALVGAWVSSGLIRRGLSLNLSRKIVLVCSAAIAGCGAGAYYVPVHSLAIAFVSLALFGHFSWATNIHTAITEISPKRSLAMLYGITGAVGTFLGAVTQPLAGRIIDQRGYEMPFLAASFLYLLAIALLLSAGKLERMRRIGPTREAMASG